MARPAKDAIRFNFKINKEAGERLRILSAMLDKTLTQLVEDLINKEYHRYYRLVERWHEISGQDPKYPLPLPGPSMEEEARLIQENEKLLDRKITQIERQIDKSIRRENKGTADEDAVARRWVKWRENSEREADEF